MAMIDKIGGERVGERERERENIHGAEMGGGGERDL